MNLPNILTIVRLFLTCVFIFFLYQRSQLLHILAVIVFIVAAWTDFWDGKLARKYNLETTFGKIMDPIADKFLVLSAFFIFADLKIISFWMFVVIAVREIFVTAVRFYAMANGRVLAAEKAGKWKTTAQMVAVGIVLFSIAGFFPLIGVRTINFTMFLVIALTVYSGASFLWNNRRAFCV